MIDLIQAKSIYDALPTAVTISNTARTVRYYYENQTIGKDTLKNSESYPIATLKFKSGSSDIDNLEGGGYQIVILSLNIYAVDVDLRSAAGEFLNGAKVASETMRLVLKDLEDNFDETMLSAGKDIFLVENSFPRDLSRISETEHTHRYQVDIRIRYKPT